MCLFNDPNHPNHPNHFLFIEKQRQVKMERGVSRREGEREKERSGLRE
jgi:hypothetical protein